MINEDILNMEGHLTVKDAAECLNIRTGALLKRIQRGSVKGQKVGWIWLISQEEVDRIRGSHNRANR